MLTLKKGAMKYKDSEGNMQDVGAIIAADAKFPDKAEVGQIISVKAVDENGKPTEFETLDGTRYYNCVEEMLADETLIEGMKVVTLGYYETNDGGRAEYVIMAESVGYCECLYNGLYASIVIGDSLCAGKIGFLPSNPNGAILENAFQYCKNITLYKGEYTLTDEIIIPSNASLDLNSSIINGSIVFDNALQSSLKNGFIKSGDENAISFINSRVGDTILEDLEISSNTTGISIESDTGNNIFRHVKINAYPCVDFVSTVQYPANYLHFDECAFYGGVGININRTSVTHLWVSKCDFTGTEGISVNANTENLYILNNAFFNCGIGVYVASGKRCWNLICTGNVFNDSSGVGLIPIKCLGTIAYSTIDNKFYNVSNGYEIATGNFTTYGQTISAIKGVLTNTIGGTNHIISNAYATEMTYAGAGTYTLSLIIEGAPKTAIPFVFAPDSATITNVEVTETRVKATVTLTEAGTIRLCAMC